MKTLDIRDAKAPLADYARSVAGQPVLVLSRGKPLAAVVSLKGMDLETASVSLNPRFQAIIKRSRARQAAEGEISADALRSELGLKPNRRK